MIATVLVSVVLTSGMAHAAPHVKSQQAVKLPHQVPLARTLDALTMPTPNALKALSSQGTGGFKNLAELAFSQQQTIDVQWKSLVMLSILGGQHSLPYLERAASSDRWYHRNAALYALPKVSRDKAVSWARQLATDPSLIVRTSAVETLRTYNDRESTKLLWSELYHERSFKSGQSLWIRRHIVETLAAFANPGDESKLVAVLKDKDTSLHGPAIQALERVTKVSLGQDNEPVAFKKKHWEKWWEARASSPTQL